MSGLRSRFAHDMCEVTCHDSSHIRGARRANVRAYNARLTLHQMPRSILPPPRALTLRCRSQIQKLSIIHMFESCCQS
jgi:hypothetical protein